MPPNHYEPIMKKIEAWIKYDKERPKSNYRTNCKEHDDFRKNNDLDCILTNGDLRADTIFSLWLPLRFSLVSINEYSKLQKYGNINDKIAFLSAISKDNVLEQLLPKDNETVKRLLALFTLGQEKCNVMILKDRRMQSRGLKPYYDYMPYFLYECFDSGYFSQYFSGGDSDLITWINSQKLNVFFEEKITKESLKDLSGSGSVKIGITKNINCLLDNYISILSQRKEELREYASNA